MLKKSLLIALIATIAMLCGLLYFSAPGSALSNGQLVTLCLGALAWLIVLFLPNHSPQSDTKNLSNNFSDLLNNIQTELTGHITATEAELAQVKSLMDNAIDDLVDSFISLEATTRIEQKLVMLLVSSQNVNDKDENNPFRDMQMKSKLLLQETSDHLNKMIKDAKHNEAACKSIAHIDTAAEQAIESLEAVLGKIGKTADMALVNSVRDSVKTMHGTISEASKVANKLHASSKLLSEESKEVAHKVSTVIAESDNNLSMVANEISLTGSQIEKDVQTAVKSLQFQDMTSQLITQCGERQKIMQQILQAVNAIGNKDSGQTTMPELQAKLRAASAELKQISSARMKQFNVDAGHVELFD